MVAPTTVSGSRGVDQQRRWFVGPGGRGVLRRGPYRRRAPDGLGRDGGRLGAGAAMPAPLSTTVASTAAADVAHAGRHLRPAGAWPGRERAAAPTVPAHTTRPRRTSVDVDGPPVSFSSLRLATGAVSPGRRRGATAGPGHGDPGAGRHSSQGGRGLGRLLGADEVVDAGRDVGDLDRARAERRVGAGGGREGAEHLPVDRVPADGHRHRCPAGRAEDRDVPAGRHRRRADVEAGDVGAGRPR